MSSRQGMYGGGWVGHAEACGILCEGLSFSVSHCPQPSFCLVAVCQSDRRLPPPDSPPPLVFLTSFVIILTSCFALMRAVVTFTESTSHLS